MRSPRAQRQLGRRLQRRDLARSWERIAFRTFADPDTSYNALEAGEIDIATIPPARSAEAQSNWGTTLDTSVAGSYHFLFNLADPRVGGEEHVLLRQAISMAIDRDAINEAVFNGLRTVSTGITPPGIPGFAETLCDYCAYDPEAAQAAYDEWLAAGNEPETIPIQFDSDAGHEPVVAIFVDNLAVIGIEASRSADHGDVLHRARRRSLCALPHRVDRRLPDVRQLHVRPVPLRLPRPEQLRRYSIPEFDALIDEAKPTADPDARAELFNQSETSSSTRTSP